MRVTGTCIGIFALAACGSSSNHLDGSVDGTSSNKVHAVAHIVAGPSVTARTLPPPPDDDPNPLPPLARFAPPPAASDGNWVVSPDKGKATLVSISFTEAPAGGGPGDNAMLTNCQLEYTRTATSTSPILDCPFDIAPGTYKGFGIALSTTYQLLIDDATNGLYTDPASATLLSTTPPGGGAQYVTLDLSVNGPTQGISYPLTAPFTVAEGSTPQITLVVDMIRSVQVSVSVGTASFRKDAGYTPIAVFGSPTGVAGAEYYAQSEGTNSYNYSNPPVDNEQVRVYYSSAMTPVALFMTPAMFASNGGAAYAIDPAGGTGARAGGYLGEDSTNTICWAGATDFTWSTYDAIYSLPTATTLSQEVVLKKHNTSTAPAPGSNGTYSSGCPTFTADKSVDVRLSAH